MATRKLTVLNPAGYQEVLQTSDTIDQLAVDNLTVGTGTVTGVVTSINGQDGAVTISTSGSTDLSYSTSTNTMESSSGNNAVIPVAVANGDDGLMSGSDKAALDTLVAATTVDGGTYAT